jgi:acetyl esterase
MKPLLKILALSIHIFCLFVRSHAFAQEEVVTKSEKIYKRVGDCELRVDVFYTSSTRQKRNNPAIAFFHGGGWVYGRPEEFHSACERFARKGFVTFSLQYRLSIMEDGTHPHPDITPIESVKDARSAIRWLRENADSLKIDPEKIAVAGQSAGGHLALSTVLMDDIDEESDNPDTSPVPNALLLYSSSVNMIEAWAEWHMGDRREQLWTISPFHNLKKGMPPAIAFHGEEDCMVPFWVIQRFEKKMRELGNHYELISYKGRKHYLGEGNEKYATYFDEEIMERTDDFLVRFGFMDGEE